MKPHFLACMVLSFGTAIASPVKVEYSGSIVQNNSPAFWGPDGAIGMPFSVSMIFDDEAPDLSSDPDLGIFISNGIAHPVTLNIGGRTFTSYGSRFDLFNSGGYADIEIISLNTFLENGEPVNLSLASIGRFTASDYSFNSNDFNTIGESGFLSHFDGAREFSFFAEDEGDASIIGYVNSFSMTTIPEPSAASLVAGLLSLAFISRRRKHRLK